MKKEKRMAMQQTVMRNELNQRMQYVAVTPLKELLKNLHTTLRISLLIHLSFLYLLIIQHFSTSVFYFKCVYHSSSAIVYVIEHYTIQF